MQKGIAFIASMQRQDGGFESFSSPTKSPFKPTITYQATFGPALILSSLSAIDDAEAQKVRNLLASWLLGQRSPHWSFNYWAKAAAQRKTLPYPDDLDDTFCALIALYRHDPLITDAACLGSVVKLLIATETQVGGPYRTWLANDEAPAAWRDVDLAVNSNIACFLGLVAEPLPNLTAMMETVIKTRSFTSPYYPSAYPLIYYLSRAYDGPLKDELAGYLKSKQRQGWWGSPLKTALALLSLNHLGAPTNQSRAINNLLDSQRTDGSWPAEAFCLDPAVKDRPYYGGSPSLTTALVLEALATQRRITEVPTATSDRPDEKLADSVYREASERQGRGTALTRQSQAVLSRMKRGDKDHEIVLLPYVFNDSLIRPLLAGRRELFKNLSLATLYGWTAYTIYDDFLDSEGDPQFLSVANSSLRDSLKHFYQALPGNKVFQALVDSTFDTIDSANAWELEHCRMAVTGQAITIGKLPHYTKTLDLANRSLGHILAPIGVLAAQGITPDDPRARQITLALRHYIAARQINDDLHDWQQDLRGGIITCVIARLLQESAVPAGTHTFARLIPKLQQRFWHHTLPATCTIITRHTALARRAARASRLLIRPNMITHLTKTIDLSVQKTLAEQSKAEAFLTAYSE